MLNSAFVDKLEEIWNTEDLGNQDFLFTNLFYEKGHETIEWVLEKLNIVKSPEKRHNVIQLAGNQIKSCDERHDDIYQAIMKFHSNFGSEYDRTITRSLSKAILSDDFFYQMIDKYHHFLGTSFFSNHLKDIRMPLVIIDELIIKAQKNEKAFIANVVLDKPSNDIDDIIHISKILNSKREDIGINRCIAIMNYMGIFKHKISLDGTICCEQFSFDLLKYCILKENLKEIIDIECYKLLAKKMEKYTNRQILELCSYLPSLKKHININSLSISIEILEEKNSL